MRFKTTRGYNFDEVSSAMQKACRRGDATLAGYWAHELFASGFGNYVWKRLLTVSAEDCWGILTQEVAALHQGYLLVNKGVPVKEAKGRIFISKAVILISQAKKSRDADHLQNFVYDQGLGVTAEKLADSLPRTPASMCPFPTTLTTVTLRPDGDAARPRKNSSSRSRPHSIRSSSAFSIT